MDKLLKGLKASIDADAKERADLIADPEALCEEYCWLQHALDVEREP